jgi:hypothetical protein
MKDSNIFIILLLGVRHCCGELWKSPTRWPPPGENLPIQGLGTLGDVGRIEVVRMVPPLLLPRPT